MVDNLYAPPKRLTGKEWEELCLRRYRADRKLQATTYKPRYHMVRYGTTSSFRKDKDTGETKLTPMASLPDFEGVVAITKQEGRFSYPVGRHFCFDCKVCSQSSWSLDQKSWLARQQQHLLERSVLGCATFVFLYLAERNLKRKQQDAVAYAIPVHPSISLWRNVDRGEVKRLTRSDCDEYGLKVEWVRNRAHRYYPDLLTAILAMMDVIDGINSRRIVL